MIIKYYKYYYYIKFPLQMVLKEKSMLVCIHTKERGYFFEK